MVDFGYRYSKISPTKDRGQEPATKNIFKQNQENNDIFQHEFDKIILQENINLSVEEEGQENIDSEVDESDIYDIYNMSLDENK